MMSCLDVERILLAAPREQTARDLAHVAGCAACGRVADSAAELECDLEQALLVETPDSLADRLLLRHEWRRRRRKRWLLAAPAAAAAAALLATHVQRPALELQPLGASHPAVAAIAEVLQEHSHMGPPSPRPAADGELRRAGLSLASADGRAEYVGECHLAGSAHCEHIVITTPRDQANVLLLPDLPPSRPLLVADRRMVALMDTARSGGFIVVADSAESATRVDKLLLRLP